MAIFDVGEEQETPMGKMDTGSITLEITEHKGSGFYITDEAKEDGYYVKEFDSTVPAKILHALKESYETDLLLTGEKYQVQADSNAINGFAHRWVASGNGGQLTPSDFAYAI